MLGLIITLYSKCCASRNVLCLCVAPPNPSLYLPAYQLSVSVDPAYIKILFLFPPCTLVACVLCNDRLKHPL